MYIPFTFGTKPSMLQERKFWSISWSREIQLPFISRKWRSHLYQCIDIVLSILQPTKTQSYSWSKIVLASFYVNLYHCLLPLWSGWAWSLRTRCRCLQTPWTKQLVLRPPLPPRPTLGRRCWPGRACAGCPCPRGAPSTGGRTDLHPPDQNKKICHWLSRSLYFFRALFHISDDTRGDIN